jgi:hypothetical protein
MRVSPACVLLVLALVPLSPAAAGSPPGPCFRCAQDVDTDPGAFTIFGLSTNESIASATSAVPGGDSGAAPRAATPTGPLLEYDYRSTCDLPGGNGGCAGGTLKCQASNTQSVFVAQRQVSPTVGAWQLQPGSVCLTPAQQLPFSPAQLQAFVDSYFQRLPLPLPALRLQPANRGVVNLPMVAATDPPGQTTFTVNQAPFPTITITAAVSWRWSWGDGTSDTSSWPGRAYDGTDPRTSPGHYVSHTYRAPSAGLPIGVTAVWAGHYTVAGGAGGQSIAGAVQRTSTRTLPVSEYGATLTGN